jgi:hypothetical protein
MIIMQIGIYGFGRIAWQYLCCVTRIAWMAVVLACAGKVSPLPAQNLQSIFDLNDDASNDGGGSTNRIWQGINIHSSSVVSEVPKLPAYQLNLNSLLMSENDKTGSEPQQPKDDMSYAITSRLIVAKQPTAASPTIFTPSSAKLQTIGPQLLGSPQGELLPGIPSKPLSFVASAELTGDSVDRQLVFPKLPYGLREDSSELSHTPSMSQLEPFLHPGDRTQHQEIAGGNSQLFHVDSFAATMTGNDTIKDAVGGQSGFFSRARLGLNYDYWRVESGIGIAWTTLLDKSKPLVDFSSQENVVWNLSLLYFPWGDFRWRPFLLLGTGISQLNTIGGNSQGNSATVYTGISHKN